MAPTMAEALIEQDRKRGKKCSGNPSEREVVRGNISLTSTLFFSGGTADARPQETKRCYARLSRDRADSCAQVIDDGADVRGCLNCRTLLVLMCTREVLFDIRCSDARCHLNCRTL